MNRERTRDAAAVAIPALLALALCCIQIASRSLGFDEGASVAIASQHGSALWSAIAHDGGNMSGYYLLLHVLIGWFGNGIFVLRFPSAVATSLGVAAVGACAIRLFDRRVAIAAGLLAVVSLPLVFWGQSARGYALMVALVAASFLAFVELVDRRLEGRPIRWAWLGYAVCTSLAIYMSFVAVLVIPAQLLSLAVARRALRPALGALGAAAIACIPLLVIALRRGSGQLFWVPRPNLSGTLPVVESLASSALRPSFHRTATSIPLLCLTGILVAAVTISIARRPPRRGDERTTWALLLVLGWLIVPVGLAVVESLLGQSIYVPRNLLMCLPAVALVLGLGVADLRLSGVLALGALAVLVGLRAQQIAPTYGVSPENWRGATNFVGGRNHARDCVAFYPSDGRMAFDYYLAADSHGLRPVLPAAPWSQVKPYVEDYSTLGPRRLSQVVTQCPRLWLVSSHEGQPDGPAGSKANYGRYLALRSALARSYPIRRPAINFGYAAPVRVQMFSR